MNEMSIKCTPIPDSCFSVRDAFNISRIVGLLNLITCCYSNGSDRSHRCRRTDQYFIFSRWRQCAPYPLIRHSMDPHKSVPRSGISISFCRAHPFTQPSNSYALQCFNGPDTHPKCLGILTRHLMDGSWTHTSLPRPTVGQCDVRHTVTFPAAGNHRHLTAYQIYCLVTEAHVCEQLAQGCCYAKAERRRIEHATSKECFLIPL